VADEVIEEMIPFMKHQFGNPSSIHKLGRETTRAIQLARKRVAALINASPREITFTSGGTESDNFALKGVAAIAKAMGKNRVVTSAIEHDAILEPCRDLERTGLAVTCLPVTTEGTVMPAELEKAMSNDVALVSIMYANNEVGTVQPVKELAKTAHAYGAVFHTDAVQAVGKIPVDVRDSGVDLLSMSSHKINGPKGVGALYIKAGTKVAPIIHGGGQEYALRSGTENVPGIAGFGKACELASSRLELYSERVSSTRNYLVTRMLSEIPHSRLNGSATSRLPGNAHFTFFGVNGEDLIIKLDEYGIAASTGSACSVKKQKPSHVLKAMGFSYEEITGSLRLSIGPQNTRQEIDRAVEAIASAIDELRKLSPFKSKYS
jgi:cysteine desulfurase